jgi:hypothetical protein
MTSAPKSYKITAAPGPAMKLAKSTTFSPEKMLLQALLDSHGVHSTDIHTLTVYGVEGIACDNETRRPHMHQFKMSPMIKKKPRKLWYT